MGRKDFDYYLFIDYSEVYLGYLIIEREKIREFLPRVMKFAHYRQLKHKAPYLKSMRKLVDINKIRSYLYKLKIRKTEATPEIYSDILDFLKKNEDKQIFASVDNKQFINFRKMIKSIDGKNVRVIKESESKRDSPEYKIDLVLDTLLNIERLTK